MTQQISENEAGKVKHEYVGAEHKFISSISS